MADLLDASVWVALSVADHEHHERALRYWREQGSGEFAFCRLTELALLRLLSGPVLLGQDRLGGEAAWQALRTWWSSPVVSRLEEPDGLDEILGAWGAAVDVRGKDWTDAYLAAFATAAGARLVSFDTDFSRYPGLSWLRLET
jgi:toxin-antitoxin system PIN domain toxin